MFRFLTIVSVFIFALCSVHAQTPDGNGIVYVKPGGTGNGDSWVNATHDLQGAIDAAGVSEVWVAAGTYKPTTTMDRSISFIMKNGVAIYGGFTGTETERIERDWRTNETIVSGDIGVPNDISDNTFQVIRNSNLDQTAILNGFIITGGNADGEFPQYYGGGIYNDSSSPTLTNITITGNAASASGAGMYNRIYSSPTLTNVTISDNTAGLSGGGITVRLGSSPILRNVLIRDNSAEKGGGVLNGGTSPTLINVTIVNNRADDGSGMYSEDDSYPTILNGIIFGNESDNVFNFRSSVEYHHSLIEGRTNTDNGNLDATGLSAADIFTDPANGDYSLKENSPAIDAGFNGHFANLDGDTKDLAGNPRLHDGVIDMGAYEFIPPGGISISKSVTSIGEYEPNAQITYEIIVTNTGAITLTGVMVVDDGTTPMVEGSFEIGDLDYNEADTIVVFHTISKEEYCSGSYTNVAIVTGLFGGNEFKDTAEVITQFSDILQSDLTLEKTVDNPNAAPGATVVFSLTARNMGGENATQVYVEDLLAAGYTYQSDNGGGAYDPITGIWDIGDLNVDQSIRLDITVVVNPSGDYRNEATIYGFECDPDNTNNSVLFQGFLGSAPNCGAFSPAISEDGNVLISGADFVTNNAAYPLTVTLYNRWGGLVEGWPHTFESPSTTYSWEACHYLGQNLEFSVANQRATCHEGQLRLSDSQGVILTSGLGNGITGPNVSDGKINVYCGATVPTSGNYVPTATSPCGGRATAPVPQPDWIMPVSCNIESDTAKVVFRTWESYDKEGRLTTLTDTIVYFRLPQLTPEAFIGSAEDSFYCELEAVPNNGEALKRYASWKQPMGLHDYEKPNTKLRGVTYEIPSTIIIAGLANAYAQGPDVYAEYLQSVIVRKAGGAVITIGDIVSGDYAAALIASASSDQLVYGFLQVLIELNENPVSVVLGSLIEFYPYLLLQEGDWVLSEGGDFEEVTSDWFYNGHGNSPFWFSGGWPSIYGSGDCVSYCDGGAGADFGCISVSVPVLTIADGLASGDCDTICLPTGVHCGITIEQDAIADWTGSCPQTRGVDTYVTQTCWAVTPNGCATDGAEPPCDDYVAADTSIVLDYSCTAKATKIHVSQWQTLFDTIGPIFDYCYPLSATVAQPEGEFSSVEDVAAALGYTLAQLQGLVENGWDHDEIQDSIRAGGQFELARVDEAANPTVYRVGTHDCAAEIFVPDVQVIDNCSGVHSVKAMVEVQGGVRSVALTQTGVEVKITPTGDTCTVYTFSHLSNPITVPFNGCDGDVTEVRYEAADNCWNQSQWSKYITIIDDTPPTVVTDRAVNLTLNDKIGWIEANTFDEGSWDNCAIEFMLARRTDWVNSIDVCGVVGPNANAEGQYETWVDILDDLGIPRNAALAAAAGASTTVSDINIDDIAVFLGDGEIEEYFFNQIVWLWEDGLNCGEKVVHAWIFALASEIAANCSATDEHGNSLDLRDLEAIFDYLFEGAGYGNEVALMGGGWAQDVPFTCEDACEDRSAELLVMDYCCNWDIGGSDVYIEDRSSARVQKPLADLDISCEAYNIFYKDIVEAAAALGENGSVNDTTGLFAELDAALGFYIATDIQDGTKDPDIHRGDGLLLTDEDLYFDYWNINCVETSESEDIEVENHEGTIDRVTEMTKTTVLDTTIHTEAHGIIGINCAGSITQDIWVDLDECGQGTITRRFFISSGCGEVGQARVVEQVITIGSTCGMRASMFNLPANVGTSDDPVCLPEGLTNAYFPASAVGELTVKDHLVGKLSNSFATGKDIKAYDVQGTDMTKYVVEWSVIDWCAPHTSTNREYKYTQEIIAVINADCEIEGPVDTTGQDTTDVSLIAGTILTEAGDAVNQVEMKAVLGSGSPLTTQTSGEGSYNFSIHNGSEVSLVPAKNTGFAKGVSTMDLIDIQRHVLQKHTLDSKYKQIAADVNGNGTIDVLDVLELRKLVMKPDSKLANNTSWRFFDTQTDKESFDLSNVNGDVTVDWIGVKIGDVNLDGDASRSSRATTGELNLNVADKALKAGELYRVDVTSDNFVNINGMQYTLSYLNNFVEVESIEAGALNVTKDNYLHYAPGVVTSSWSEADAQSLSGEAVLFTIVVKAKSEVQLRDVFSLNNRVTRTEAYDAEGGLKDVSLRFDGQESGFALYQNTPNPYAGETVVGFKLPEVSKATLSVYDVTGKVLKVVEGEFNQGYNEVKLKGSDLNTTGVLYYQLDTKAYTATKKMIVIDY